MIKDTKPRDQINYFELIRNRKSRQFNVITKYNYFVVKVILKIFIKNGPLIKVDVSRKRNVRTL